VLINDSKHICARYAAKVNRTKTWLAPTEAILCWKWSRNGSR